MGAISSARSHCGTKRWLEAKADVEKAFCFERYQNVYTESMRPPFLVAYSKAPSDGGLLAILAIILVLSSLATIPTTMPATILRQWKKLQNIPRATMCDIKHESNESCNFSM